MEISSGRDQPSRAVVVVVRHGESEYVAQRRFTGWTDVDLTPEGIRQAQHAGKMMKRMGYKFDVAYTSVLKRCIKTLYHIQDEMDQHWVPTHKHWHLNERMYGALQGHKGEDMLGEYGEEALLSMTRTFSGKPPAVNISHPAWPGHQAKYKNIPDRLLPCHESLDDVSKRVIPYWMENIIPKIKEQQRALVVSHAGVIRVLLQHLCGMDENEAASQRIPTGVPLICELNNNLKAENIYYLTEDGTTLYSSKSNNFR